MGGSASPPQSTAASSTRPAPLSPPAASPTGRVWTRWTTRALAERVAFWRGDGRDVAFLIGGPDGLDPALKATADETARLSDLTLPHAFVRVLLAEALYRAWSLSTGHPYHRE